MTIARSGDAPLAMVPLDAAEIVTKADIEPLRASMRRLEDKVDAKLTDVMEMLTKLTAQTEQICENTAAQKQEGAVSAVDEDKQATPEAALPRGRTKTKMIADEEL